MVILTYLPWHDQFFKLLNLLGELKTQKNHELRSFIAQVYAKPIPEAGSTLHLNPLGAGYKVCLISFDEALLIL